MQKTYQRNSVQKFKGVIVIKDMKQRKLKQILNFIENQQLHIQVVLQMKKESLNQEEKQFVIFLYYMEVLKKSYGSGLELFK